MRPALRMARERRSDLVRFVEHRRSPPAPRPAPPRVNPSISVRSNRRPRARIQIQSEDEYRKPGLSKERRLEPQITLGAVRRHIRLSLGATKLRGQPRRDHDHRSGAQAVPGAARTQRHHRRGGCGDVLRTEPHICAKEVIGAYHRRIVEQHLPPETLFLIDALYAGECGS